MKPWYESLFENYGNKYDNEAFTHGTLGECDFIENEASFNKNIRILDIGCGTGRHSIELTKRGYNITGIDLSESMLERARQKSIVEGLSIDFRREDARNLPFYEEFDLAVMLCEGGFPLMETDEMNFEILKNASQAIKPGGKLIFTTLNGLFPLFHSVKDFIDNQHVEGNAETVSSHFDLMSFRDFNTTRIEDDHGNIHDLQCSERYYVPSEITWLLKAVGFSQISIFGARLGKFSRTHKLTTEDFEMLVVAEKP